MLRIRRAVEIHQEAGGWFDARWHYGVALKHSFDPGRAGYLYVIDGEAVAGETALAGGDAAKLQGPEDLVVSGRGVAEVILVEAPLEFRPVGVWAS